MKIKLLLIFLIAFVAFSAHSQAPVDSLKQDSVKVKLEQYKKLLDDGTIGEDEYNRKKAELMGTKQSEIKQPEVVRPDLVIRKSDTIPMQVLKERYKSKIIAGSVILSVGTAFVVGDILLAATGRKLHSTDSLYSQEVATRHGSEAALGVLGGLASAGGAVFLALGLKDKAVYRRRGKELSFNFNGQELEIAFRF